MEDAQGPERYLAQFRLRTVLRVPPAADSAECATADGTRYVLKNSSAQDPDETLLDLNIIFNATSLQQAEDASADLALDFANALSFAGNCAVRLGRRVFLIEWEPGRAQRNQIVYIKAVNADPVDALTADFLESVTAIDRATMSSEARAALRWCARAARARYHEDRIEYYWFAIELMAVSTSTPGKVHDTCSRCGTALACTNPDCPGHPPHRKYEKQRIREMLERMGMRASLVAEIFELRNLLLHGADREEIDAYMTKRAADFGFDKAEHLVRAYAVRAVKEAMTFDDNDEPKFYDVEDTLDSFVTGRAHMAIGLKGDVNDPKIEDVWTASLDMIVTDPATGKRREARKSED